MAEYISREAVLKCIENDGYEGEYDLGYYAHNSEFQELIEEIPAADVVEVVRCKDCKHRDNGMCFMHHDYGEIVYLDGYCNYAEEGEE